MPKKPETDTFSNYPIIGWIQLTFSLTHISPDEREKKKQTTTFKGSKFYP